MDRLHENFFTLVVIYLIILFYILTCFLKKKKKKQNFPKVLPWKRNLLCNVLFILFNKSEVRMMNA